jgi:hypothetical protein
MEYLTACGLPLSVRLPNPTARIDETISAGYGHATKNMARVPSESMQCLHAMLFPAKEG